MNDVDDGEVQRLAAVSAAANDFLQNDLCAGACRYTPCVCHALEVVRKALCDDDGNPKDLEG